MKPKTKTIEDFIKGARFQNKKILFVLPELTKNGLVLSGRNIQNVEFSQSQNLNPYIVMDSQEVVFVGDAIDRLEKHYSATNEN